MSSQNLPQEEVIIRIQATWVHLTDEDVQQGLKHRDTFLDRLCRRHHFGMDEADAQLKAFEKSNPGVVFERY